MTVHTRQGGQAELPTPHSTDSYWHHEPSRLLAGHRTTEHLPCEADIIVIGSGMTGAFAARELCHNKWNKSVLMLEAREACWGATGRNGGHCQPLIYLQPVPVAAFELDTYNYLDSLITRNGIECDWKTLGGVHPIKTPKLLAAVKLRLQNIAKESPSLAAKVKVVEDPAQMKALRVEGAVGFVYQMCAAKCWPYKLVAWVLESLIREAAANRNDQGKRLFNLQTNTPVTSLQKRHDGAWTVDTARGQVSAKQVLLATNAYTSHLLPLMSELIVPTRGQVSALKAPTGSVQLQHSYGWIDHEGGDNYLIQRDENQGEEGLLILGGERLRAPGEEVGVSRDDVINEDVARSLRRALHSALRLKKNESEEEDEELEAAYEWTGIMGYSKDGYPWVGEVPELLGGGKGLWMSAGYTGHGMPVAARTGIAVAEQMLGMDTEKRTVVLPQEYEICAKRAEGAIIEDLHSMEPTSRSKPETRLSVD